ncbi:MAG: hypothetical protein LBS19_00625 [Clostridiales bacterium]|jgi:hypothetical protein|nr:hypothetical protein [Clostridiales bacterium]
MKSEYTIKDLATRCREIIYGVVIDLAKGQQAEAVTALERMMQQLEAIANEEGK